MIARVIRWSLQNRLLVLLLTGMVVAWGLVAVQRTPLDAIPDLSDVQIIIKTSFPGQAPQVVEDQVTYPLTTAMLSVPQALTVRGFSLFGDSFVYVIFKDGTDLYWARSRVLEYLSQVTPRLPRGAKPELGPDATGVGWVYQYALVDRSNRHNHAQLRSLQDWFLKYELRALPGVAEVASLGGMTKQYQVTLDPDRLRAYRLTLSQVRTAISSANQEVGGSVIEMAEAEYMVRARGYIKSEADLRAIPLGVTSSGAPIRLEHIADIQIGPEMRRGMADVNGEGEAVGGIIVMRSGENALATIATVKQKLDQLKAGLPEGVEIITTYDRSGLIQRAIRNLAGTLIEEFIVVAMVCVVFLLHLRSSLVAMITLPIGILIAFIVMQRQGINANIMSLGGIAIAIGAMVDAAIVMIENVHKHIEHSDKTVDRWLLVERATLEVGPALFFSLLIITFSFIPVFALEAQEGRLFAPLAYTKTYAMAAAAGLSITLVPVLMGYFIRGRIRAEHANPINRWLINAYRPLLQWVLQRPKVMLWAAAALVAVSAWPALQLGTEFMPDMDEGDMLYMPTTLPGLSIGKAEQLLQQTDRILKTFPEVESVFGKAGRAETATDPAPINMFETTIRLKPQSQWRPGMTSKKLMEQMRAAVKIPGLPDVFVMPIKTRIDMLSTGIRTPVGIKVNGPDLGVIEKVGKQIESVVQRIPGTLSVYAERVTGGRYIDVNVDRYAAAHFGLNIADVQDVVSIALGGITISESIEGRERYAVNLRYPRALRDSLERVRALPIITESGAQIALSEVADIRLVDGPDMIKSENARLSGWISVDLAGRDLGSYVHTAQQAVAAQVKLPPGYSLEWSGQFEYLERAKQRLSLVIPLTLAIILLLLYMHFRNTAEVLIILATLPLALVGGLWLLYFMDYHLSVAAGVGFIALGGVAVEIGVVMLAYLDHAVARRRTTGQHLTEHDLHDAIIEGALLRIRPVTMTKVAIIAALLPILFSHGTGSEPMQRIAAPMVGGMLSVAVLTLAVIPAAYLLWRRRELRVTRKKTGMHSVEK